MNALKRRVASAAAIIFLCPVLWILFPITLFPTSPVLSQIIDSPDAASERYRELARAKNIAVEVEYADTQGVVPPPEPLQLSGEALRILLILIAIGVLFGIAYLASRYGGIGVSRRHSGSGKAFKHAAGKDNQTPPVVQEPVNIENILEIEDRDFALCELARYVLKLIAERNGIKLRRSDTIREGLKRLPHDLPNFTAVRELAMKSEAVIFGGAHIDEQMFLAYLGSVSPVLNDGSA